MWLLLACDAEPAWIAPKEVAAPPPSRVEVPPGEPAAPAAEGAGSPSPDASALEAVIRASRGAIEDCADAALARDPTLAGRVDVAWRVTEGRVSGARLVKDETGDDALVACVIAVVSAYRFPVTVTGDASYGWKFAGD